MAFLLPRLAPPKKRKGPIKRCRGCGSHGTKGFTKGPGWGEWYHVGCFSKAKFVSCSLCNTVVNRDETEDSIIDDSGPRCSMCHDDELDFIAMHRKCIRGGCDRTAVEEVNPGHWFCRKHVPNGAYLVVTSNKQYFY